MKPHFVMKDKYTFLAWATDTQNDMNKTIHELRKRGFRKTNVDYGSQDMYTTYKKKKKIVTIIEALC